MVGLREVHRGAGGAQVRGELVAAAVAAQHQHLAAAPAFALQLRPQGCGIELAGGVGRRHAQRGRARLPDGGPATCPGRWRRRGSPAGQGRAANSAGLAAKKWLTAFGLTNITKA